MTTPEPTGHAAATAADLSQVIELMTTDKSNDWSEEIAVLVNLEQQLLTPPVTVADLDGTVDEASWVRSGHVLDDHEVAYIRSLFAPGSPTHPQEESDG